MNPPSPGLSLPDSHILFAFGFMCLRGELTEILSAYLLRHSRENGDPGRLSLDSRFRGNDEAN